ncbi:hypothetical protein JT359_18410 [Candidatus Poribacteria bacterium]|nr:hypothetical protein [Candidatus Poribacteria bacterium]
MKTYKIYPVAAADASIAFQIELDPRAIAAAEELENSNLQGAEREEILQKHFEEDYEKGYRGTAWGLYGISAGMTPVRLAELLTEHGESFDPCAERDTFDHSLMVNVEEELASQLDYIPKSVLIQIVETYKNTLLGL